MGSSDGTQRAQLYDFKIDRKKQQTSSMSLRYFLSFILVHQIFLGCTRKSVYSRCILGQVIMLKTFKNMKTKVNKQINSNVCFLRAIEWDMDTFKQRHTRLNTTATLVSRTHTGHWCEQEVFRGVTGEWGGGRGLQGYRGWGRGYEWTAWKVANTFHSSFLSKTQSTQALSLYQLKC